MHLSKPRQITHTVLGVIFLAAMLFPVYWMVNVSLQAGGGGANSTLFPTEISFSGYQQAFEQQSANIVTSLIISLGTVILSLAVSAPAAYALAKFRLPGGPLMILALLVTQMIPSIVIANSLYPAYNTAGLLNSRLGLVLADASTAIPFAILILYSFMVSLPKELIEAAKVDGAGHFRAFFSIVLPVSRNALITAALFSFLFSWGDFLFALTLTTGTDLRPVTLGIYAYLSGNVQSWGPVMATGVLSAIPAVVFLIFAQRYISVGQLGGAVK